MSATQQQSSVNGTVTPRAGGLADASLREALSVLATAVAPALVRGLFAARRGAMKRLTRLDADARAISVLTGVRRRHGGDGVRLLGGRLIVLWGPDAIREVLDRALTLSRGPEWRDRRAFNEAVLASREHVHPDARRFAEVVADEVDRMPLGQMLEWRDWDRLFDLITLRVIFGDRARCDQRLTGLLETLLREGNRLIGLRPNDDYHELYGELERRVRDPEPGSLLAWIDDAPHGDGTRMVQQIPHWMFAMRLWPTTPRDRDHVEDADRLVPERWRSSEIKDYRFNHLSNGSQDCPGGPLVMLLGKAAIAQMLSRWTLGSSVPMLPAGGPMPAMFDLYSARFTARRR